MSVRVQGFWRWFCALNRKANRHGGGDFATRGTIHTIGVSFTFELAIKALYEETLGRLSAAIRGPEKTPQDVYSAKMAADYAQFLQHVPWYKYDFGARSMLFGRSRSHRRFADRKDGWRSAVSGRQRPVKRK